MNATLLYFIALSYLLLLVFIITVLWKVISGFASGRIPNRAEKLTAIGLTAIFFSDTIYWSAVAPIGKLLKYFQETVLIICTSVGPNKPLETFQIQYDAIISNFPLGNLLIFIAVSLIIYKLILVLRKPGLPTLVNWGKRAIPAIVFYNTFISLILMMSLFLVIAVFTAIPYLNEVKKQTDVTHLSLDTALRQMSVRDSLFVSDQAKAVSPFKDNFTANDLFLGLPLKLVVYNKMNATKKKVIDGRIANFRQRQLDGISDRNILFERIKSYGRNFRKDRDSVISRLTHEYSEGFSDPIVDKSRLFKDAVLIFEDFIKFQKTNYLNQINLIKKADDDNSQMIAAEIKKMQALADDIAQSGSKVNETNVEQRYPLPAFSMYLYVISEYNFSNNLYVHKRDGSEWGMFGWNAHFLIATGSLEFILLIGMFAFGVLGASILSIVNTDNFFESFKKEPIIKNFVNVLARGFGAALIIYLATKAGLTIFTGGNTPDPNGYMLLLTCFIGAVYSEPVWTSMSNYTSSLVAARKAGATIVIKLTSQNPLIAPASLNGASVTLTGAASYTAVHNATDPDGQFSVIVAQEGNYLIVASLNNNGTLITGTYSGTVTANKPVDITLL